jgi:hypothetical protein
VNRTRRLSAGLSCLTVIYIISSVSIFRISRVAAQTVPPIKTLAPSGGFDIPVTGGQRVASVQSNAMGLWFLLMGGTAAPEAVLVNSDGTLQKRIILATTQLDGIKEFCASPDGNVAALHRSGLLDMYSASGQTLGSVKLAPSIFGCTFSNQGLLAADRGQVISLAGMSARTIAQPSQPLLWPNIMLSLENNRIGIVEMGEAVVNVLDITTAQWQRLQLSAPEIQGVPRQERTSTIVYSAVFSAAIDSSGDIYAAIGPSVVSQGAILLKFGADGSFKSRLRCTLPKSRDLVTAKIPDGHFIVTHISVTDGKLFLVSRARNKCLYYVPE